MKVLKKIGKVMAVLFLVLMLGLAALDIYLIKLLPVLRIPEWLYGWIGMIAFIKVVNIISGFAIQKRFVAIHSVMNKVAGALLFLLPLTIPAVPLKYSAIVVCAVATFDAIQEGHFIRTCLDLS